MPTKAPTAPQIHERHAEARKAMARRLAAHLRDTGDEMLTDPDLLAWLPKRRLDAIARRAGERRTPSMDTWRVVLDLLRTPECPTCHRPLDADPFANLPGGF